MELDADGRWHPETEGFEPTRADWVAHWFRVARWILFGVIAVIALGWAYNAGMLKNEAPDYYQVPSEIEAPGQG